MPCCPALPSLADCLRRACLCLTLRAAPFDAAPFGLPLPQGNGVMWEDPREIHQVVVHFKDGPRAGECPPGVLGQPLARATSAQGPRAGRRQCRLDGTRELVHLQVAHRGYRSQGRWQRHHVHLPSGQCERVSQPERLSRRLRYTLKLRVVSDAPLPKIERIERSRTPPWSRASSIWPGNRPPPTRPASRYSTARSRSSSRLRPTAPA